MMIPQVQPTERIRRAAARELLRREQQRRPSERPQLWRGDEIADRFGVRPGASRQQRRLAVSLLMRDLPARGYAVLYNLVEDGYALIPDVLAGGAR